RADPVHHDAGRLPVDDHLPAMVGRPHRPGAGVWRPFHDPAGAAPTVAVGHVRHHPAPAAGVFRRVHRLPAVRHGPTDIAGPADPGGRTRLGLAPPRPRLV